MYFCKIKSYFFIYLGQPLLYWVSRHMSMWSTIAFNLAVLVNIIVAIFYPFPDFSGWYSLVYFIFYVIYVNFFVNHKMYLSIFIFK